MIDGLGRFISSCKINKIGTSKAQRNVIRFNKLDKETQNFLKYTAWVIKNNTEGFIICKT